uniref:Hexosyltransferase n=1 Tax=Oryza sativa subsp. japonica TaxID=39947 RepID=Q7XKW1_ORYSJ|nr:OSJNBa0073E02.8 [Oryza sativa Japonica Group]
MRSPTPARLALALVAALAAAALLGGAAAAAATEEAYVTLLYGDEFVLGVRVLGKSIRDTGTRRDLVVLVSDGVSDYSRKLLQADGWIVSHITLLANPNQVRPKRFWGVYTKLKIFNMTSYRKVVYLDADTVVVKSIEDLFKCGKFCGNLKHSERMNSGVMVVEPSETVFKDMMRQIDTLPSYTGGCNSVECLYSDQGFLNSYYADFANSHVYEPEKPYTPEPETQRLSTLYNADVGLYMLANKTCSINLLQEKVQEKGEFGWLMKRNLESFTTRWVPLNTGTGGQLWLVKPVGVWQDVRQTLEESLPGTGGGRSPHDQLVVKVLFILPVLLLTCGYNQSCSQFSNGMHSKLPSYFGALTVLACFMSAGVSFAFAFAIIPKQIMPWTGLLLMFEWTFVSFFLLFGSYLRFVYRWGSLDANHVGHSRFDSSENHMVTGRHHNMSDCDIDATFYWTGMAIIAIVTVLLPTLLGVTALFANAE